MRRTVATLMGAWIAVLCIGYSSVAHGAQDHAGPTTDYEVSFVVLGMSCEVCAQSAIEALRAGVPDLRSASVDFATKQGRVTSTEPVNKTQVREALGTLGFEARFPDDPPPLPPIPDDVCPASIRTAGLTTIRSAGAGSGLVGPEP